MNQIVNMNFATARGKAISSMSSLALTDEEDSVFNASAVRARAGVLNVILGTTIFMLLAKPELDPVIYVAPFLLFDMITAVVLGLTPVSPTGVIGTLLTMRRRPVWTPRAPKRFAWCLGGSLASTILILRLLSFQAAWLIGVLGIFFLLTWLDAVLGFCVGCWIYSKLYGCEKCKIG